MALNSVNAFKAMNRNKIYRLATSENFTYVSPTHDGIVLLAPTSYSGTITNTAMVNGESMTIYLTTEADPRTYFDYPSLGSGDYNVAGEIFIQKIDGYRYGRFNATAAVDANFSDLNTWMPTVSALYTHSASLLRYPSKLTTVSSLVNAWPTTSSINAKSVSLLKYPALASAVSSLIANVWPSRISDIDLGSANYNASGTDLTSRTLFRVVDGSDTNRLILPYTAYKEYQIVNADTASKVIISVSATASAFNIPPNTTAKVVCMPANKYTFLADNQVQLDNSCTLTNKKIKAPYIESQMGIASRFKVLIDTVEQTVSNSIASIPIIGDGDVFVMADITQMLQNKTVSGGTVKSATINLKNVTPVNAVNASYRTIFGDNNKNLIYTARTAGAAGNTIQMQYAASTASVAFSVSTAASLITVQLHTVSGGTVSGDNTASRVASGIRAKASASTLVTVACASSGGTGVVSAMGAFPCSGGVNGTTSDAYQIIADSSRLYFATAANTVSGKNWKAVSLISL